MSYGLITRNADNQVVIDSDYRNLVLRSKQTAYISPYQQACGGVIRSVGRVTFSYSGAIAPLILLESGISAGIGNLVISGSTYTWTVCSNSAGNVTAYIFDMPPVVPATYGINVFDQSSNLVFSSDYKYLRVIDNFTVPYSVNPYSFPTVSRSYSGSRSLAVGISCPRCIEIIAPFAVTDFDGSSTTTNSITVAFNVGDMQCYISTIGKLQTYASGSTSVIVADVTGY